MNVFWTSLAEERVAEIIASMQVHRIGAAWRWQYALLGRIRGLSETCTRPQGIYESYFAPCRVVYRIERDRMLVLTLHAASPYRTSARYEERPPAALPAGPGRSSAA